MKNIIVPVTVASVLLMIGGVCSTPFLGDEIYHLRFAKDAYNSNSRPVFDSQYGTLEMPTILYTSPPFWNLLLAMLWKITGGISIFVAQFYQVIFYVIIIVGTYLIGRELYSEKEARIASLLVATVPMIVSFSILLYTDVPVVALSLIGLLLTIKKKYLLAGCFWGFALLTKNSAAFFIPAIMLALFFEKNCKLSTKLKNIILMLLPLCILQFIDFRWRSNIFPAASSGPSGVVSISGLLSRIIATVTSFKGREYLCSHLLNISDLLMYLGIVFVVLTIFYFLERKYEKRDVYLIVFIASYVIGTFAMVGWNTDVRYFMPIVPLLCILCSKVNIGSIWIKRLLVCACIFQFVATASYVCYKRNISSQLNEAFDFIKNNTAVDSLMLYPESNIQEYAQRKLIWSNFKPSTRLKDIFWLDDINEIKNTISLNNINYIVIKKTRCYDDTKVRHIGGYPNSFVKKLPNYEFVKLIFDNEEIAVWKIEKQNLGAEWR